MGHPSDVDHDDAPVVSGTLEDLAREIKDQVARNPYYGVAIRCARCPGWMTSDGTTWTCQACGATEATNLDGAGVSAEIVDEEVWFLTYEQFHRTGLRDCDYAYHPGFLRRPKSVLDRISAAMLRENALRQSESGYDVYIHLHLFAAHEHPIPGYQDPDDL
jgi:hypothetical protein